MDGVDCKFIEHVDTNLATVEVRHMDILIKVLLDQQPILVHCEIQTDDSTHLNMVQRMSDIWVGVMKNMGCLSILSSCIYGQLRALGIQVGISKMYLGTVLSLNIK